MRKKPRQARSREMVEGLVLAAMDVIAERGLHDLTTNHIAARAGVSVGSLYQYFADKHALLDAVLEKLTRDLKRALDAPLRQHDSDLHGLTRAALNAVFDLFERNRGLYLELARGWYHARTMRAADTLEQYLAEAFRLYLLRHHPQFRFENLPAVLFVTINSAIFTGMRYFGRSAPHLQRAEVIEQLTQMLAGHLLREGGAASAGKPIKPPSRSRRVGSRHAARDSR